MRHRVQIYLLTPRRKPEDRDTPPVLQPSLDIDADTDDQARSTIRSRLEKDYGWQVRTISATPPKDGRPAGYVVYVYQEQAPQPPPYRRG